MNTGTPEVYDNPALAEQIETAQKSDALMSYVKQQKKFQAEQHFRQLLRCRKVNKGRKAGRKTTLYLKVK